MHGHVRLCFVWLQAYYRRGDAKLALGRFGAALKDFKLAAAAAPKDPDLKRKLAECAKESQRLRFEKALRSGARCFLGFLCALCQQLLQESQRVRTKKVLRSRVCFSGLSRFLCANALVVAMCEKALRCGASRIVPMQSHLYVL